MVKRVFFSILILSLGLVYRQAGVQARNIAETDGSYSLRGKITGPLESPVEGAFVFAMNTSAITKASTYSGADGSFSLDGLDDGAYYVAVRAPDGSGLAGRYYHSNPSNAGCDDDNTTPILIEGADVENIDISLSPQVTVSGVVKDNSNTPLEGIEVEVTPKDGGQMRSATSLADGTYSIGNLGSGCTYVARVRNSNYLLQYYNGVGTHSEATTITIAEAGGTRTGVDFHLTPAAHFSGKVTRASDASGIAYAFVFVMDNRHRQLTFDYTDAEGNYSLPGLPPGQYYIAAKAGGVGGMYYAGGCDDPHATMLELGMESRAGIDLSLPLESTLRGNVSLPGGLPSSGARVDVFPFYGGQSRTTFTNSSGEFEIGDLAPCSYAVKVQATGYASQFYSGAYSLPSATPVNLPTPGSSIEQIDFTLQAGGTIRGKIQDASGNAILTSMEMRLFDNPNYYTRLVMSSASDGTYQIEGLLPGAYRLLAMPPYSATQPMWSRSWHLDQRSYEEADWIVVDGGETLENVNFTLQPGAALTGRVQDESGQPVNGVCVVAFTNPKNLFYTSGYCGQTTSDQFSLNRLQAGPYYLRTWFAGRGQNQRLDEWYRSDGSTTDPAQAEAVMLAEGQSLEGLVFTLKERGAAVVSGHVFDESGFVISGTPITVHLISAIDGAVVGSAAVSQSDGTYRFAGIKPGWYILKANGDEHPDFSVRYYDGQLVGAQADILELDAGETLSDIDVRLPRTCSVTVNAGSESTLEYIPPETNMGVQTAVHIPAGAVDEDTLLVFRPGGELDSSPGFSFAGQAFSIDAFVNYQPQQEFIFNQPVHVTINYQDVDVAGLAEEEITLQAWNELAGEWEDAACGPYIRDTVENRLEVDICHLSDFAIARAEKARFLPWLRR